MPTPNIPALLTQLRADLVALVDDRIAAIVRELDDLPAKPAPRPRRRTAHVPAAVPSDLDRARARAVLREMGLPVPVPEVKR